jgi:hypothetical protein
VARLEVPFQAVDGCARPEPCGGVGFTQGLSGLKRAFEFPMLFEWQGESAVKIDLENYH